MKVFVSSTVFDLLDIRVEVESHLSNMGITPVLSGSLTSAFDVMPDRNSIDTCLVNLESCEAIVVILCQRYGPSLKNAGFEDLSATHLEYRRAKEKKIPLYVYVRDRLEADYRYWRNLSEATRSEARYSWVKGKGDNLRLFDLLHEHQELKSTSPATNWYWPFRDSMELKRLLTRDFGDRAAIGNIEMLVQSDRMPVLQPTCEIDSFVFVNNGTAHIVAMFRIRLRNVSSTAAFDVRIELAHDWLPARLHHESCVSIAPGEVLTFTIALDGLYNEADIKSSLLLQYASVHGHQIQDRHDLWNAATYHLEQETDPVESILRRREFMPSGSSKPYRIVDKFSKNLE